MNQEVFLYKKLMAENKKSFVAYCDWIEIFEELEDIEAGKLAKHLFRYVNDLEPEAQSREVKLCFISIKQSLKRDLKKYEGYIDKQKINGAKGGRPKKTQKTQPFISKPKKADSVSVSVSVNDSVINKKEKYTKELFLQDWNTLRLKHLKKPSHLNRLKPYEIEIFKEIEKCYARADIKNGLVGLFKQKEMFNGMESMRTNPSHFLEKFEQYLTAFTDQNSNLYGQNK
tara:strand:- start:2654 stop:3337 length:684 start_codon:yes stop_codon:yes gene_type:complete